MSAAVAPLLDDLGQKLADKWLTALVVPGLLLIGGVWCAVDLGQRSALDRHAAAAAISHRTAAVSAWSGVGRTAALVSLVLASAAVGTLVRALAAGLWVLWTGRWPGPLRPLALRLTASRRARWHALQDELDRLRTGTPPSRRGPELLRAIDELSARRDRVALAGPDRPTFTGDRLAATAARVHNQYGADLASVWTRLWVVIPEDLRGELRSSRARLASAVEGSAWAVCCLALGCAWWPAAVAGAVVAPAAWHRGRAAADAHADLVEAVADVHLGTLAREVRVAGPDQPLDHTVGAALTRLARKGR